MFGTYARAKAVARAVLTHTEAIEGTKACPADTSGESPMIAWRSPRQKKGTFMQGFYAFVLLMVFSLNAPCLAELVATDF